MILRNKFDLKLHKLLYIEGLNGVIGKNHLAQILHRMGVSLSFDSGMGYAASVILWSERSERGRFPARGRGQVLEDIWASSCFSLLSVYRDDLIGLRNEYAGGVETASRMA